jgi:hypothetical protein
MMDEGDARRHKKAQAQAMEKHEKKNRKHHQRKHGTPSRSRTPKRRQIPALRRVSSLEAEPIGDDNRPRTTTPRKDGLHTRAHLLANDPELKAAVDKSVRAKLNHSFEIASEVNDIEAYSDFSAAFIQSVTGAKMKLLLTDLSQSMPSVKTNPPTKNHTYQELEKQLQIIFLLEQKVDFLDEPQEAI